MYPGRADLAPRGGSTGGSLCDSPGVSEPNPLRRRDPAWLWYALAVAALAMVAILDLTGVLDRLGP